MPFPAILQKYVDLHPTASDAHPRRVKRRFHGRDVSGWQGHIHVDDVEGWVENIRLRFFLNHWRARVADSSRLPTTDDIYQIMIEADREEERESAKPFHVERLAENIARNGIQEPISVFLGSDGRCTLWDGNRRFYASLHIQRSARFAERREATQWIPAFVVETTGDPLDDELLRHAVLTELNFVEKDHIPWPTYVKAEQISQDYERMTASDPADPVFCRDVKERLAKAYGLKNWRVADRWIKMYQRAQQFKEFHEEERARPSVDVDLLIQERFEYFDELSKPGVWGALQNDADARDEVFTWLWDGKFQSFADVRSVPRILVDPVAREYANSGDKEGVRRALDHLIANDPVRVKDKRAANGKVDQFAKWLNSFKREDFKQLNSDSLQNLRAILTDVVRMLEGLLAETRHAEDTDDRDK